MGLLGSALVIFQAQVRGEKGGGIVAGKVDRIWCVLLPPFPTLPQPSCPILYSLNPVLPSPCSRSALSRWFICYDGQRESQQSASDFPTIVPSAVLFIARAPSVTGTLCFTTVNTKRRGALMMVGPSRSGHDFLYSCMWLYPGHLTQKSFPSVVINSRK